MAAKIKQTQPGSTVDLIKGSKGAYIVTVDGKEVWNKHEMDNQFPDEDKLVGGLGKAG